MVKRKRPQKKSNKHHLLSERLKKTYYDVASPGSFGGLRQIKPPKTSLKKVQAWAQTQPTYTLHKPVRKHFPRNRVVVQGLDHLWQADLLDMQAYRQQNRGIRYLLAVIDVLSKFAYVEPLKNKTGTEVKTALEKIFSSGRKPLQLQTDSGTEFKNKVVQDYLKQENVHFYVPHSEQHAQVAERFIRTLKQLIWRYFTYSNKYKYLDVLPDLVKRYNNTYHRTIKRTPASVDIFNDQEVWKQVYGQAIKKPVPKFKVGEQVRISKTGVIFRKGYLPGWTEEVFTVSRVITSRQYPVYKLKEYNGTEIEGTFYEAQLQKVVQTDDDLFRIEKVIKKRKVKGGKTQLYIKWLGWPETYNSWVDQSSVQQ